MVINRKTNWIFIKYIDYNIIELKKISLRKMPHGKHVPFEVHTNDPHKCSKSNNKKVVKKCQKRAF